MTTLDTLRSVPSPDPSDVLVRRARISDVRAVKSLVDHYAGKLLLAKQLVTLYEDVQEFRVAVRGDEVVGCGALHVLWEDLAEIRTLAVHPSVLGLGVGAGLVQALVGQAHDLGLQRVFVLTFEERFFRRHGFVRIEGAPVTPEVYDQMRRSHDEGVAEFLDLPFVKPNTLGNSRMLLTL